MELPVVDLGGIGTAASTRAKAAAALDEALAAGGCAALVRHGVHPRLVARTFDAFRTFFALPDPVKRQVAGSGVGYRDGACESFVAHPAHDPRRAANRWPVDVVGFRETLVAYLGASSVLADRVALLAAMALGHDEQALAPGLAHAALTLCAERHAGRGAVAEPSGPAGSSLTLVGADGVDGLELRDASGAWVPVSVPRGSLVVLAGGALVDLGDGRWPATAHRVVPVGVPRLVVALHHALDEASGSVPHPRSATRVA